VADIAREVGVAHATAERFFARWSLPERSRWDETKPEGASSRDWYPWRYMRKLSLLARPIVRLTDGGIARAVVCPGLLQEAAGYLLSGIEAGWFPSEFVDSDEMRVWLGTAAARRGHQFNEEVASRFREMGFEARSSVNLTELGFDASLGDIDVLAWRAIDRRILVVECKHLRMARTVGEIARELERFRGEEGDELGRHLRRVAAAQGFPAELTRIVSFSAPARVESMLVTNTRVPMQYVDMQYVDDLPIDPSQIVDYSSLRERFGS
jgi:hypothetical protein